MKIGVVYYPEQWDRSIWEADADLMQKSGVKIVRMAEFAWCRIEPREGVFEFAWLDEAIEIFAKRDIEIFLCTPTNCPPLWLYEKYPDAIQVGTDRNKINLGIRGHRCYNSPSMLKYSERIIDIMTKRYAGNPAVVGWQIDNELDAAHCCCEYCSPKFRAWLKEKYSTIDKINTAYGNSVWSGEYSSWEQVNPPYGGSKWLNPSLLLDYNRFTSYSMAQFVEFQMNLIRKNCPNTQITINTWLCENMPDFYDAFENLDFVSYDNYPAAKLPSNGEKLYSHSFHLDLMRGIKQKNFWIMEQLSGLLGGWTPMQRAPRPGMIKGYALQAIARGADTVIHFRWRSAVKGAEMFWHGLIDHSNVPGRRFHEFESLCHIVNNHLKRVNDTTIKNKVAILYSSEQEYAFKIQPQAEGMHYYGQLKSYHDAFTRFGVGTDIINWSSSLDEYNIVVAPTMYITNEQVTINLYKFAANGGTLILTNRSGVKDVNNTCIMDQLPTVFKECAGIVVSEYDPIGTDNHTVRHDDGKIYDCEQWCDIIETTTAKALAVYNDDYYEGKPAVTVNNYKEGKVYYVGTVFKKAYYYKLISEILKENGIEYYDNLPDGIELSIRENERESYLFVFNNSENIQKFEAKKTYRSIVNNGMEGTCFMLKPFEMEILK